MGMATINASGVIILKVILKTIAAKFRTKFHVTPCI
jgi:hypothetical protein